jgi:hypothetical protein
VKAKWHFSLYFAFENKLCHMTSWLFTSVRIWSVKFVISVHKGTLQTLYTTLPDLIDATRFIPGMPTTSAWGFEYRIIMPWHYIWNTKKDILLPYSFAQDRIFLPWSP